MKNFVKVIGFNAPKTAGSTLVSLNYAMLYQFSHPNQKIAFVQLTQFPDAHLFSGVKNDVSLADAKPFLDHGEFSAEILKSLAKHQGCDIFLSPGWQDWESISSSEFKVIFAALSEYYDVLCLDLHESMPSDVFSFIQKKLSSLLLISSLDPASLEATKIATEKFKVVSDIQLIINQCSNPAQLKKWGEALGISVFSVLPPDEKAVWRNLFESFPLAFNQQSRCRKVLMRAIENL